jgi:hypothetical protein
MNDVRAGRMARARMARAVADLVAVPLVAIAHVAMEMRVRPAPAEQAEPADQLVERVGPGDLRVRERADQNEAALVERGDPIGAGDLIVRERRVAHPPAEKVAATLGVSAIRS